MKSDTTTAMALLLAGLFGAYAWAPAYSATQDSGQGYSEAASATQAPGAQSPMGMQPTEKMMPGKNSDVCARLDKNQDGYITKKEFKASGKPDTVFNSADTGHRGKLNMEECSKALSG